MANGKYARMVVDGVKDQSMDPASLITAFLNYMSEADLQDLLESEGYLENQEEELEELDEVAWSVESGGDHVEITFRSKSSGRFTTETVTTVEELEDLKDSYKWISQAVDYYREALDHLRGLENPEE